MSSLVKVAMRRAGEGRLDVPVALMMAVSAGALMFMMPVWRLEQAATASGLAGIFPPAAPPLGFTARTIAALVAALVGFGLAYAAMRLVERASGLFEPAPREEEEEEPAPRMRRRDLHPDAPIRRPLSAMRELGQPAPEEPEPVAPRRRPPLAAALEEAEAMPRMPWEKERSAAEPEPQPRVRRPLFADAEPVGEVAEDAKDGVNEPLQITEAPRGFMQDQPVGDQVETGTATPLEVEAEPLGGEHVVVEPQPVAAPPEPIDVVAEPLPAPEPEPADIAVGQLPERDPEVAETAPAPAPVRAASSRPDGQESIGELLARFERALDRRQSPAPRRQSLPTAPLPSAETADPIDGRLRSALENLKRFAPQRG